MNALTRRSFLLGLLAGGCAEGGPHGEVVVAAGEQGGFYYDFAALLAARLEPGLRGRVLATKGSVDNLRVLGQGRAHVALTLADAAHAADPAVGLRAIGRVYENYLQFVVRADDPARSVPELAGRVVSLGAEGSGAALIGDRIFTSLALHGTARVEHLPLAEAATALAERRIDALLWSGGVPTPALAGLSGIRLLPLAELLPGLRAAHGSVYEQVSVPAGVYEAAQEVPTVGVANLLVCRESLPRDVVAAITRTLLDQAAALVPEQALGTQFLDVRSLIGTVGLPLHPGAAATYRAVHG